MRKDLGQNLNLYIVGGRDADENWITEYCGASTAQLAVNRVREWYQNDNKPIEIIEVAKVIHNWK